MRRSTSPPQACLRAAALVLLAAGPGAGKGAGNEAPVSFRGQIAPILVARCQSCHGDREAMGDFRVDTFEHMDRDGFEDMGVVLPGRPDQSALIDLLETDDPAYRMPPDGHRLTPAEVGLFRRWVAEGVTYDATDPTRPLAEVVAAKAARPRPAAPPAAPSHGAGVSGRVSGTPRSGRPASRDGGRCVSPTGPERSHPQ